MKFKETVLAPDRAGILIGYSGFGLRVSNLNTCSQLIITQTLFSNGSEQYLSDFAIRIDPKEATVSLDVYTGPRPMTLTLPNPLEACSWPLYPCICSDKVSDRYRIWDAKGFYNTDAFGNTGSESYRRYTIRFGSRGFSEVVHINLMGYEFNISC